MKKQLAYLIITVLGLPALLCAKPFNSAQEEAFARASVGLLEWVLFIDNEFNSDRVADLSTQLGVVQQGFAAVVDLEGLANLRRVDGVRFEQTDYDRRELLLNVQHYLTQIQGSLEALQRYLVAAEADQGIFERTGLYATGHTDDWRIENDWVEEYEYDYGRDSFRVGRNNELVVTWAPPQNVVDHFVERIRGGIRALMVEMGPILRNVYEVRSDLTMPEGLESPLNVEDVADAFLNRIGPAYAIERRVTNEEGVDVRRVTNIILRDLDTWLNLQGMEFSEIDDSPAVNTYRFHEGQREAFARAMTEFLHWVADAQNPLNLSIFESLRARLQEIRSAFRGVRHARSQQEHYEFLFGIVEEAVEEDDEDVVHPSPLNNLFVNTHGERVHNQIALTQRDRVTGVATFNYDGLEILNTIDARLRQVDFLIEGIIFQMRSYYATELLEGQRGESRWDRMQALLDQLINDMRPLFQNVYGINRANGERLHDLTLGFEQWLDQFERDYRPLGGLAPGAMPVTLRQVPESVRDLWNNAAPQMNAAAEPFYPTHYDNEEEEEDEEEEYDAYVEDDFYGYEEAEEVYGQYPQQVYPMGHIQIQQPQLQPGQQPPMHGQQQVIMVQPMHQHQYPPMVPGYGYPQQQQYYMPQQNPYLQQQGGYLVVPQRPNPNAGYVPDLQMPQPVRPPVYTLITGFGC